MQVTIIPCGPAANESELKAFELLKNRLQSAPGEGKWILLANLAFSVDHHLQSDEIDIVAIGPSGIKVVEIKHWNPQWVKKNAYEVEQEADKVANKARKIGTTLRRKFRSLPYVDCSILLTRDPSEVERLNGKMVRGVRFCTLNAWKEAIGFAGKPTLSPSQVDLLSQLLAPKSKVAIDGSIRRLGGYINLELQTPREERFHRIYKGVHSVRQDRVILHLYDLSASDDKNAESKAMREFEALQRLQLFAWAPRILDSFQSAPGYAGEMFFFTVVDPAAPCVADRASDDTWDTMGRLAFARNVVRALSELHGKDTGGQPFVHRNLNPRTILVKHDNSPILTGFDRMKIPSKVTVASKQIPREQESTIAPEVRTQGFGVADQRSDVYSLCASLNVLFQERHDELSGFALEALAKGLAEEPQERCTLNDLEESFSQLLGESVSPPAAPPARFWTEDQVVRFRGRDYRLVSRLGSGGVGTAFKVVEIEPSTKEELGTYVAKVAHDAEVGRRALKSYGLARSHLGRHAGLSAIYEVAREWRANDFVALMTWVDGTPLGEFTGVFPLLAEEQQEASSEALAIRWLRLMCEALDVLHRNGLVHGDVSPRNMIVCGSDLVLTDYDFVNKIGEPIRGPGTVLYCSPSYGERRPSSASDDIYALAASFFHVVFDREPFRYGGELAKEKGVNWEGIDRNDYPLLAAFIDKATHPAPSQRFSSATEALAALTTPQPAEEPPGEELARKPLETEPSKLQELREHKIEWLRSLLQSYPGSRWGNCETRGLDTPFAAQTYVETQLEQTLERDIRERRVRLVILCGNAGDGKTALLQHLATRLGLGEHKSSERLLKGRMKDGLIVRMNLDGSAAWRGRSADEILDKFLAPFQEGPPTEDIVHMLAINDGRLLEWIEGVEQRNGKETVLTEELYELLQAEAAKRESHIRFINLNRRSLVGGVTPDRKAIRTDFVERLLDQLYGDDKASNIWGPCQSCSAKERCEVFRAARVFGPDGVPEPVDSETRQRARRRLFEALQAVHLRGETHITIRELRAALVYILFGVHFCDDYHNGSDVTPLPYWDRAFVSDSPGRQGEVLRELARFDPALEAHPQIDRYLLSKPFAESTKTAPRYEQLSLESARRRAYFEWTEKHIEQIAGDPGVLDLARGRDLQLFRNLALVQEADELRTLRDRLCAGISRLEDLPPQALDREGVVPLRITPRTPTETAFWVEKPLDAFRIEPDLPAAVEGIDRLHRHAFLIYRYRDGREERLRLGAELFHLLLELSDGYQLGDVSTDDTFANLSIFVQRLVREDERELLVWNPMQDEIIYRVFAEIDERSEGPRQQIVLKPLPLGGQP
jgi:serine/threonine protein kinase